LAFAKRTAAGIKGVVQGEEEHKMLMYADDILLLIKDPLVLIPNVLSTIESFSKISGYEMNWQKSECMPISRGCIISMVDSFQFK